MEAHRLSPEGAIGCTYIWTLLYVPVELYHQAVLHYQIADIRRLYPNPPVRTYVWFQTFAIVYLSALLYIKGV